MDINEYLRRQKVEGQTIIEVLNHKTSLTKGPAKVAKHLDGRFFIANWHRNQKVYELMQTTAMHNGISLPTPTAH